MDKTSFGYNTLSIGAPMGREKIGVCARGPPRARTPQHRVYPHVGAPRLSALGAPCLSTFAPRV